MPDKLCQYKRDIYVFMWLININMQHDKVDMQPIYKEQRNKKQTQFGQIRKKLHFMFVQLL